ncbi:MAG: sialidase [Gemmatimonadetes bacterium]|nr:sialidase [Gemmatimonadota bacterium]
MNRLRALALLLPALLGAAFAPLAAQHADALPAGLFDGLQYRYIGPVGNRVSAVAGVPGAPFVYYFGAASGGVFKTTDGGVHWTPVFDDQDVMSVGALAVAPSDSSIVWVGTGEAHIRSNVSIGAGVFRSLDGGRTWTHMGLAETGRIGRIRIHPRDPNTVYVAALGHLYGPQEERGVFRTRDGGETWDRVLFVDDSTGAYDLEMDPEDPSVLYASTWQMWIRTWGRWSGGPGSGIFATRDGGDTWTRLEGNGLPEEHVGKIGLAMSAADPARLYALIETNANRAVGDVDPQHGVLWRSDDRGRTWRIVSREHALNQRPAYYTRIVASPTDADVVYTLATRFLVSRDGGESFQRGTPGGDHHDMWIDPLDPDRQIVGHDGGVSITVDGGRQWTRPRLPIAQMYHVYTDSRIPYGVYGNRQDGPSMAGPSNSLTGGTIPIGEWHSVGGCESGFAVPDPVEPDVVWSGCYEGILQRYDHRTGLARTVSVWPDNPEGWEAGPLRYRFQWTFPIAISPHDHTRVYVGSQHVHRTTNGGQTWEVISPDLTTDDPTLQQKSGGLTPDDVSPTYASVLFAIAESPRERGVIWAGSNDGLVHVTRDDGATWTDVTAGLEGLPPLGTVSNVEPSRHADGTAYVTVDLHQLGDTRPYVYRTADYGRTWTSIADGIPVGTFSYVHVVREDPVRPGLLYLGTENGLYVSFDDGDSWTPLQANLPRAPVHWLEIQPHFNDLVVATYGRGFWILDDVTALQQLDTAALARDAHLFAARPAYRFHMKEAPQSQPEDPAAGRNPTYGASLNLWVAQTPRDARLEVVDASGTVIRRAPLNRLRAGINRLHWDLEEDASRTPRLRTQPLEHEHVELNADGWRPAPEGGGVAPLAPPGRYTVRVSIDGRTLETPLEVRKDPTATGSLADIEAQVALIRDIRDRTNAVADLIDEIEILRARVDELEADAAGAEAVLRTAAVLDRELIDLEMGLIDLRLTGGNAGQDSLRWPRQLYAKLMSLAGYASGTDQPPTDATLEVFALYQQWLADAQARMDAIRTGALARLNAALVAAGRAPVG